MGCWRGGGEREGRWGHCAPEPEAEHGEEGSKTTQSASWRTAGSWLITATRMVSVVKDLTMRQRAGERELYEEAAKKNLTSSQE